MSAYESKEYCNLCTSHHWQDETCPVRAAAYVIEACRTLGFEEVERLVAKYKQERADEAARAAKARQEADVQRKQHLLREAEETVARLRKELGS